MSRNRIHWDGLTELKAALRRLPHDLRDDGSDIVINAAEDAHAEIYRKYPEVTGRLKRGLKLERESSAFGVAAVLINRAKHAWLFENGTQMRRDRFGRNRGAMPPGRVFIPTVIKHRRRMWQRLKDLIARAGLEVRDDAA